MIGIKDDSAALSHCCDVVMLVLRAHPRFLSVDNERNPDTSGRALSGRHKPRRRLAATEALGIPSFETMDRLGRAVTARITQGVSPHALYAAWFDWASHLANAPGRLVELGLEAVNIGARFARFATHSLSENVKLPFEPQAEIRRFNDGLWKRPPYALWQQAFLAQEAWWRSATREVRGMTPKNAARISFITRQLLDVRSPSNVPWPNPVVIEATLTSIGANLMRGAHQSPGGFRRALATEPEPPADGLEVGKDLAVTPGKVVFRNELIELIQYSPTTPAVLPSRPDRAGLDHEVLHPRPVAEELAGRLARRPGLHGVHDVVEEPDRGGPRARHGRLPAQGRHGGARRRQRHRAGPQGPRRRLLHRRHAALDRGGGAWRATRTTALRTSRCSPRRRISASPAS